MDTRDYYDNLTPDQRVETASAAGISVAYLYQICTGHRRASPALAQIMETASGGKMNKSDFRPDIWPPEAVA